MRVDKINDETLEQLELYADGKAERGKFLLRPLTKKDMPYMKKNLPFSVFSTGEFDEMNSMLPNGVFSKYNDIAFMTVNEQKYKNIGFVMLGHFYGDSEKPDSVEMYIAKKKDKKITLWKNLKTMPGFENLYKYGNSDFVQKQRVVPGADHNTAGVMAVHNNSYEMTQAIRLFLKSAEKNGYTKKLMHAIQIDDYDFMDNFSVFQKSDSWSTKYNDLLSGKLENSLFTTSQIKDTDILKSRTLLGEQYLLKRKLNVALFDDIQKIFKRSSTDNRIDMLKKLREHKKNEENFDLIKLKDFYKQKNLENFKTHLDSTKRFSTLIDDMMKKRVGEDYENITSEVLLKAQSMIEDTDYLDETTEIMTRLRNLRDKKAKIQEAKKFSNKKIPKFEKYSFSRETVENLIKDISEKNKEVKEYLGKSMEKAINSKVDATVDSKYFNYYNKSKNKTKMMDLIEKDINREFYDRYNEKMELYDIMLKNRRGNKVSEVDMIADRVKFKYDKEGNIKDVVISPKEITGRRSLKDNELKWGYYKKRREMGSFEFDKYTIEERLELAKNYLKEQKSLLRKHSQKTILGKYDTLREFKDTIDGVENSKDKFEMVTGDIISRTNDKIIANATKDEELFIRGAIKQGSNMFHLKIKLDKADGFNYNDYTKELMSNKAASFKMEDLEHQLLFNKATKMYNKNYRLQRLIVNTQLSMKLKAQKENKEIDKVRYEELNQYLSFLKGGNVRSGRKDIFGLKDGELVLLKNYKGDKTVTDFSNVDKGEKYRAIYSKIIENLNKNNRSEVGYAISEVFLSHNEQMQSTSKLASFLLDKKFTKHMNEDTFLAILNRDEIINTSGAAKQTGATHGDTYLGSLGYAQPGLAWNKVTQRTFQAQDILGEQVINVGNEEKTISEINASIIKKLGFSGVGSRDGKYTTEEMYKKIINDFNKEKGIHNSIYKRGEVFKTFAIGDVNENLPGGLGKYSLSFQEGMTAARSMILTTNAIRNKNYNININELNLEELGYSLKELHEALQDKDTLNDILSKILKKDLYDTIEGRKDFESKMKNISSEESLAIMDINDKYDGMVNYYEYIADVFGVEAKKFRRKDTEENRREVTKEIYKLLSDSRTNTKSVALPTTRKGKVIITDDRFVKTKNELKPELGFTIRDFEYNPQTKNIELNLENIGINTQGTKNQTIGAKFTVSEIQDFLKISKDNAEYYIDAVFNNKAEKRKQTGMMIHGTLQTAFANVYNDSGKQGVIELRNELSGLLKDMDVSIKITKTGYSIEENYLTHNLKGVGFTQESFKKYMSDPTYNTNKIFTEKGNEILNTLTKKYGSTYFNGEKRIAKDSVHFGIISEIQRGYLQTYKNLDIKESLPLTITGAAISGIHDMKETMFGKGDFVLMRLPSERVNSSASKKKESALKVSREMLGMLKSIGYHKLTDHLESKNKEKVSQYLGDVYSIMNNSELLKTAYSYNKKFDIENLNMAMSNTLTNGVLFDLNLIEKGDYLINDSEVYLKHNELMASSVLGKAITNKELDEVYNGKLANQVNVVIQDKGITDFTKQIKTSVNNSIKYLDKITDENGEKKYESITSFLKQLNVMDMSDEDSINYLTNKGKRVSEFLERTKASNEVIGDIAITKKFVDMINNNTYSKYSLKQLQNIITTGNILTTIGLGYDVNESDGSIVASDSFRRIQSIAKKNYELKTQVSSSSKFLKKLKKSDEDLPEFILSEMEEFFSGKKDYSEIKFYSEIISNTEEKSLNYVREALFQNIQSKHRLRAKVERTNDFLQKHHSELGLTKEEMENVINNSNASIEEFKKEIVSSDNKMLNIFNKKRDEIKNELKKVLFEDKKLNFEGKKISFGSFFKKVQSEDFGAGFDLLNEYIKINPEAEKIFKKKGKLIDSQKFLISSSFIANPLEGSNLLNKMEQELFGRARNAKEFERGFGELTEFLGSEIVNSRLFEGDNGVNFLEKIKDSTNDSEFRSALKEARSIFNKNFNNIAEVVITEKKYTNSFRNKGINSTVTDVLNNKTFHEQGFVREMAFLSRHPQQTINHMGGVMQITIDSESKSLKNRFARLALPYLPKEKNNAGVITLGKRTMLFRRGDHDGDKVSSAYLDFLISDREVLEATKQRIFVDFQIKNNALGQWNEVKGKYDKFYGSVLKDGQVIKLASLDKNEALEILKDITGFNEEELNMQTKAFNMYSRVVSARTEKEFGKHYNEIYSMMGHIRDFAKGDYQIDREAFNLLEQTVWDIDHKIGTASGRERIKASRNVIRGLKYGEKIEDADIFGMDIVTSTALYKILKNEATDDYEKFKKSVFKDISKFISRGDFDKIKDTKSSKAVFDELTNVRNTGKTFTFATQIRTTGIEVAEMDPTSIIGKLGNYFKTGLFSIDELETIKKRQQYYNKTSVDLFVDNMIESAISAKHGLTLGGLEGSKIFITSILKKYDRDLQDNIINMYEETFVKNNNYKLANIIENVAEFKKQFDLRNDVLEEVTNEITAKNLDVSIFYKSIDLGSEEFKTTTKNILTAEQTKQYLGFHKKYMKKVTEIENSMFENLMKNQYVNADEFEIYRGLNLFAELLIQNDPGLEYDAEDVLSVVKSFKESKMTDEDIKKFLSNKEIIKIKDQLQVSLGSAASISNIAQMKNYISAYQAEVIYEHTYDNVAKKFHNMGLIKDDDLFSVITKDFKMKKDFKTRLSHNSEKLKKIEKILSEASINVKNSIYAFENSVNSNSSPISVFAEAMNQNNTLFTLKGKSGQQSLDLLDTFKEYGVESLNESVLSNSIKNMSKQNSSVRKQIFEEMKKYDVNFENFELSDYELLNKGYVDDKIKKNVLQQIEKNIDEVIFDLYRKDKITEKYNIAQPGERYTKILFSDNLSEYEKKMVEKGKIYAIDNKNIDNNAIFSILNSSDRKYYLSDVSVFYDKKGLNKERLKKLRGAIYSKKLYVTDDVAKYLYNYDNNLKNILLSPEDKVEVVQDLLNAKKYFNEDFTKENVIKRLKKELDPILASRVAAEHHFNINDITDTDYKDKFITALNGIVRDFGSVDKNISNSYVNENYLKLAKIYVDQGREYKPISSLRTSGTRIKEARTFLKNVISKNKEWFKENEIEEELFDRLALSEIVNNTKKTDKNTILRNVIEAMTEKEDAIKTFKYEGKVDKLMNALGNKKNAIGLAGLLSAGAMIVKPFFSKTGGKYIINSTRASEQEIFDNLNFTNGKTSNILEEELRRNINAPRYVNIKNNKWF